MRSTCLGQGTGGAVVEIGGHRTARTGISNDRKEREGAMIGGTVTRRHNRTPRPVCWWLVIRRTWVIWIYPN